MVMLAAYRDLEKLNLSSDMTMENTNASDTCVDDETFFQLQDAND